MVSQPLGPLLYTNVQIVFVLFLTCVNLLSTEVDGVQIVQKPRDKPQSEPLTFAGGKDVFGRPPSCRACHYLIQNLEGSLVPKLQALNASEAKRKVTNNPNGRRVDYGKTETVIEDAVERGCHFSSVFHFKDSKRACLKLVEEHQDAIIDTYSQWLRAPWEDVAAWDWNMKLCHDAMPACSLALASHPLSDFEDDGTGSQDRTYRSEQLPKKGEREGNIYKAVAGSFLEFAVNDVKKDILVYFAFPTESVEYHDNVIPLLHRAADLFAEGTEDGPLPFRVAKLDAEQNDVPPPYGTGITKPSIAMFPSGATDKKTPRYMTNADEGEITLYDIIYFVMNTARTERVALYAIHLIESMDKAELYRTVQDWVDYRNEL